MEKRLGSWKDEKGEWRKKEGDSVKCSKKE